MILVAVGWNGKNVSVLNKNKMPKNCKVRRRIFTDIFVPELVNLVVVGQAALHGVHAEGGAGLDVRKTFAGGADGHPPDSIQTLCGGRHLQ